MGPLRQSLAPIKEKIKLAFVYGSVAKRRDTATSDIDLMVISDSLTYVDIFIALEDVTLRLNGTINPTVYSQEEFEKRIREENAFLARVLSQPKLWVFGEEHDIAVG